MPDGLRSIPLAQVDTKIRPVLLLTREVALGYLDQVQTVPSKALGRPVGFLQPHQEVALTSAVHAAYDLA